MNEQATLFPGLPSLAEVCGLTDWRKGLPPCSGWWKTRRVSSPDLMQPQRRWYHAEAESWSPPARPHFTAEECAGIRSMISHVKFTEIEWCGLAQDPAPWLRGEKQP